MNGPGDLIPVNPGRDGCWPPLRDQPALTDRGGSVAAVASGQWVPQSIADCDRALELLRMLVRSGTVDERRVARIAADDVLDRRNELCAEQAASGAQS